MIILIIGLSRAGKTTYSQKYENVIHLDDYKGDCYEGVMAALKRSKGDIVIEGIYSRAWRRKAILHERKHEDKKICIWLDTPLETRKKREGYYRYDEYFEPPALDEGWDEIIIIRGEYEQRINRQTED